MGFGNRLRDLGAQVQRLQQQAEALQQQAMAMHAHQTAGDAPGDGSSAPTGWDPTALLPAPTEFVKRGTCVACGAPKELPTVRQHLYCDFCGQLTDYDLRRAMEAATANPTAVAYAEVANRIGPEAERVRRTGDRVRHLALQRELHAAQAAFTPWAVPPRAWNDERYRGQWIEYSAAVAHVAAFDPTAAAYADQVRALSLRLQWKGGMGLGIAGGMVATVRRMATHGLDPQQMTPKAELRSFLPLAETVLEQTQHTAALIRREGLHELDPDGGYVELHDRLARSVLAQGWLPHLEPDDGEELVTWLGLRHEYQRARTDGDRRSCGGCGYGITALPGASRVVCEACGRALAVDVPAVPCTGCGTRVAFPEGVTHQHCPACRAELRRV